ncbi:MAG: alpha-galactosidase [Acidobacteriaceae bacterium]|nr:alpha-galactosidase [Acidobacteriaceae bacterium]
MSLRAATASASILVAALFAMPFARSQSIEYRPDAKLWVIQAGDFTYAMGVDERNWLQSLYWGPRIDRAEDIAAAHSLPEVVSFDLPTTTTPQEYAAWGAGLYTEPDLKATFSSGNRDVVLAYVDQHQTHDANSQTLDITMRDIKLPLVVHLFYRVYTGQSVLERWTTIENQTKEAVVLENAASATWSLPNLQNSNYRAHWLTGRWAGEWQLQSAPLNVGSQVIESRRGSTGHQANPWFAIEGPDSTDEEHGPVYFGELGWSGSWRITIEQSSFHQVRITGGYNPFDFGYRLAPGESLTTPPFYGGFTGGGMGEASRILHHFQQGVILPGAPHPKLRPILYNSWEATEFNVGESGQFALAEKAAALGVERFVIDDGWFGQRKDDHAGLGDWYVNKEKFPNGLKPVIDRVHQLGMDFGIWVEPEMVNPDSDLYRKHPAWAMNFPGRPRTEGRNQLLLNFARPDVMEYTYHWLDELVSNNDIDFLKWDYNRNWSEPGWDAVPVADQKKIYVAYIHNLYTILDRLRAKHPKLEIESCSGGGGRVDLGILRHTVEVWPSDNTDALDRLSLQDGFSHAYTPGVMMAWVTDPQRTRKTSLKFRFLVAMEGSLGIGANLNNFTPEDMATAKDLVAFYKTIRPTVQQGLQYRLIAPSRPGAPSERAATEYVSTDRTQAVVFAYLHSQNFGDPYPLVRLSGLDSKATYRLHPLDAKQLLSQQEASGSYWMSHGLQLDLRGDYDSTAVVLERTH